jgi:hypothetical protein
VGDTQPPRLRSLRPTLKVPTDFSTTPGENYPSVDDVLADQCVAEHMLKSKRFPKFVFYLFIGPSMNHPAIPCILAFSSLLNPIPVNTHSPPQLEYYTASVDVPIHLPKSCDVFPTFHSCLLSRTYTLELCMSYHMPGATTLPQTTIVEAPVKNITMNTQEDASGLLPHPSQEPEGIGSQFVLLSAPCYITHVPLVTTKILPSIRCGHQC